MNIRLLGVTLLLSISCAQTLPLEGAPCPCASGWVCCPGANICAKDAAQCPAQPAPVLDPAAATVSITRRFDFKSSEPVTFSVEEAAGGTIDSTGRYTAPAAPGTFHVVATRASDHVSARAAVTVVPLQLASIAGRYGGPSSIPIDGVGDDARFVAPEGGIYVDGFYYLIDHMRADQGTNSLRRVNLATGAVETLFEGFFIPYPGTNLVAVVDGPRATATFAAPTAVASDSQGHLLVADVCMIRSIDLGDLSVKTLMGANIALSDCPASAVVGLASDGADQIFYTLGDPFFGGGGKETVVRQLTVSTGAQSILAGQLGVSGTTDGPQGTFTNPGALAYFHEQFNPTLQVFDDYDQVVRSINLVGATQVSTTFGPSGSTFVAIAAPPTSYGGMLAEADGLMIPTAYDRLQQFHPTLPVHPTGLAVISVDISGPQNVTPPCDGTWTCPMALVPAAEGTFHRYDLTLGLLETVAGRSGSPPEARDGNGESASFALGTYYPALMASAGDDLFIWEPSRTIRKIDRAANVTTPWTNIDATLLAGDASTLYLASTTFLQKAPSAGGDWTTIAGTQMTGHAVDGTGAAASFSKIVGLVVEPNGKLAVLDDDDNTTLLREVDPGTGVVKTIATLPNMINGQPLLFDFPTASVTLGPTGKLIALSDYGVHAIDLVTGQVDDLFVDFMNGNPYTHVAYDSGKAFLTHGEEVDALDVATRQVTPFVGQLGHGAVRPGTLDHALLHLPGPMAVLPNGDLAILDLTERALVEVK